jgi:hypothetical protein
MLDTGNGGAWRVLHGTGRRAAGRRTDAGLPGRGHRACTDIAARRVLLRYGTRGTSEDEERDFEQHILRCDDCFDDVLAVWRVAALLDAAECRTGPEGSGRDAGAVLRA